MRNQFKIGTYIAGWNEGGIKKLLELLSMAREAGRA